MPPEFASIVVGVKAELPLGSDMSRTDILHEFLNLEFFCLKNDVLDSHN